MRTARSQSRATAFAQWQHEQRRDASPMDHTDDIEALTRALAGDLSAYAPQGVLNMIFRLAWLENHR